MDGAKVRRAVTLECQSNDGIGHQTLCTFDDFHALACRHGAPTDAGIDPVLTTQQYMEAHKLVPLLESMTAAVMTAKPEDPKKFLEQTLRDYAFRDVPVLGYDDKDLDAVFTQYDITRSGKITREQCDAAMIAMTGHKANVWGGVERSGDQGGVHAARQGRTEHVHGVASATVRDEIAESSLEYY